MLRAAAVSALALALLLAPAAARADVGGSDIVAFLNAQRAAQGIPAGIAEDASLSDGCAKHDHYGALNGTLDHTEDPSRPGYTDAGKAAAAVSVLYAGSGPWTAAANPFESAPIHLHQRLAPRLDRMGAAETDTPDGASGTPMGTGGYGCATTLASRARPAPATDTTDTYPGDGATGWPAAQTAAEGPYTPGERVGIPAGTTTGPYLYVMFDGAGFSVNAIASGAAATLTGPEGSVPVAVVDNTTDGLKDYLPTGMEVIPRAPLRTNSTYTASVSASVSDNGGPARTFAKTWSFSTGTPPPAPPAAAPTPTPGPATPPAATPTTTTAPRAFTLSSFHVTAAGRRAISVQVGCTTACVLTGAGTVRAGGKTARLRTAHARRRTAGRATLRLVLTEKAARRLRGPRTLRFTLTATGGRRTIRRTLTLQL